LCVAARAAVSTVHRRRSGTLVTSALHLDERRDAVEDPVQTERELRVRRLPLVERAGPDDRTDFGERPGSTSAASMRP
jgi:hypothetical protein